MPAAPLSGNAGSNPFMTMPTSAAPLTAMPVGMPFAGGAVPFMSLLPADHVSAMLAAGAVPSAAEPKRKPRAPRRPQSAHTFFQKALVREGGATRRRRRCGG